jgi:3-hydroxybutyryl-CoA dehydrogenase
MMEIKKVGVLGCGQMGSGVVQVSAQAGYDVIFTEASQELIDKGLATIDKFLSKGVEKGKIKEEDKINVLSRIKGTLELKDFSNCDLLIEAVVENMDIKKKLLSQLEEICPPNTIFASNTSSLSITEMASVTKRPNRFIGLHFFNPVPLMPLVEVVKTIITSDEVFETGFQFAQSLGKSPIKTFDKTGFIVNRLLVPYLLDAIRALEEGVGTIEDIDSGMKLGCGYPMGPFTLLDFIGLDTILYIGEIMFDEFKEKRFAAPPLLRKMVAAGQLGRKSGKGFYDYSKK